MSEQTSDFFFFRDTHPNIRLGMPGMDGIELAMSAKKLSADIPVILCTGGKDLIDSEQIKQACVTGTISKPYGNNELDATIKRIINENIEVQL